MLIRPLTTYKACIYCMYWVVKNVSIHYLLLLYTEQHGCSAAYKTLKRKKLKRQGKSRGGCHQTVDNKVSVMAASTVVTSIRRKKMKR